jgi:uncharacterized membrane protein
LIKYRALQRIHFTIEFKSFYSQIFYTSLLIIVDKIITIICASNVVVLLSILYRSALWKRISNCWMFHSVIVIAVCVLPYLFYWQLILAGHDSLYKCLRAVSKVLKALMGALFLNNEQENNLEYIDFNKSVLK